MEKLIAKVRIDKALTTSRPMSRASLQTHLNDIKSHSESEINKPQLLCYINEMIKDGRLVRIGKSNKVKYKLYEAPAIKESNLWITPKFKRPNLAKIWHDRVMKVFVINGCACGGSRNEKQNTK